MAKLVNYTCSNCNQNFEDIFNDTEESPQVYGLCEVCNEGQLVKNNVKNNCQVDKCFSGYAS